MNLWGEVQYDVAMMQVCLVSDREMVPFTKMTTPEKILKNALLQARSHGGPIGAPAPSPVVGTSEPPVLGAFGIC